MEPRRYCAEINQLLVKAIPSFFYFYIYPVRPGERTKCASEGFVILFSFLAARRFLASGAV
jgi:hypothetical protein